MLTLRRQPRLDTAVPDLDEVQRAAVTHTGPLLRVLGGPGTGKTTVAIEVLVGAVGRGEAAPHECLVLTSSRLAAGALRDRVTSRLGGTSTEPLARTHQSFGFGILRRMAALAGDPTPRLLSGPEQDVILRDLLAGYLAGDAPAPPWPPGLREALSTRGFRAELRDLLMRAVEHDLEPDDLIRLGERYERPEWVAGAQVLRDYDQVTAFSAPGAYDPAWILGAAADRLEEAPEELDRLRSELRLLVVDDAQEMTPAAVRLLETVTGPRTRVVLVGDPDAAVQTFRGADPRYLATGWTGLGEGPTLILPTSYRLPTEVLSAAQRVAPKIGALGGGEQRRCAPGPGGGTVQVHLVRAVAQEAALVAGELRRAHLLDGVPWSQMAVVVRGRGRTSTLRRALGAAGIPVVSSAADTPVREEVAVRPLLALLEVVLGLADGSVEGVDPVLAVDALLSPLGGMDAVALRRLRRALRRLELEGGGGRPSDDLVAEALVHPDRLALVGPEGVGARRVARVVAAGVAACTAPDQGPGGATAESVLWAMWQASGLGPLWQRTALDGGPGALRADRDLDAVLGLFDAAAKFVDRLPQAGPAEFLLHIQSQDIAGDTLVARSPSGESVEVLTPAAAAGRQWRLVAVPGVQEGVWPDLRLRGSLLGSEELVDVLTGRGRSHRARQAAVRYDETRLFYAAITRASERLIVTAVRSDDEQPSVYLDIVDPLPEKATDSDAGTRPFTEVGRPLTLAGVVAQLRQHLLDDEPATRAAAVAGLGRLAAERVPGADPDDWWGLRELTDDRPLRAADQQVRVSPSKVESFGRCNLRWLLTQSGGEGPSMGAASIGTLVHDVVADLGDVDAPALRAEVDRRWGRLGLQDGWLSERKRGEAHRMVDLLAGYFEKAETEGWHRVGAEVAMRVTLGRATLSGRVDRLERDDQGRLRVVDYKTGSSAPTKEELTRHPQLGAYQLAVQEGAFGAHGSESAGAALLQVGKKARVREANLQVQGPLQDHEDPQWAADLVRRTADGMAGSTFTAGVGQWCQTCAVRSSCPAQPEGRTL